MNKKYLVLILVVLMLFAAAGVVSARPAPVDTIYMDPDTTLNVVCLGGSIQVIVDVNGKNDPYQTEAQLICYSILPPGPYE